MISDRNFLNDRGNLKLRKIYKLIDDELDFRRNLLDHSEKNQKGISDSLSSLERELIINTHRFRFEEIRDIKSFIDSDLKTFEEVIQIFEWVRINLPSGEEELSRIELETEKEIGGRK